MKIDNRQRLLAIVAISCVALFAADQLIVTPLTRIWKEHSRRITELSVNVNRGRVLLAREKQIRERWTGMKSNTLPANVSMAEGKVLRAVDQWARESGITFSSIRPQWKQNTEGYMTLECQADASGNLQSVARFLYNLERDPLPLRVKDFEITAKDNDGQQLLLVVRFSGLVLTGEKK